MKIVSCFLEKNGICGRDAEALRKVYTDFHAHKVAQQDFTFEIHMYVTLYNS